MVHVHIRVLNCAEIRSKQPLILSLNFILKQEIQSEWTFSCCVFYQNLCNEDDQGAKHKKADKSILYSYPLDYERKNMAVVAGQQIIFIPPWRLILPLIFFRDPSLLCFCLVFFLWTYDFNHCSLSSHVNIKTFIGSIIIMFSTILHILINLLSIYIMYEIKF